MVHRFPRREAWVDFGVPARGHLIWAEQADLAPLRCEDAGIDHARDRCVLCFRKSFGDAVFTLSETRLFEPREDHRVSESKSPSCSASASSRVWFISVSAS